jgi:sugar lactone lactonase YvrE
MSYASRIRYVLGLVMLAAMVMLAEGIFAAGDADPNSAPNPYRVDEGWAKLPPGRKWGAAIGVDIDRDGKSVWVFDRCGTADDCSGSDLAPIQKFDASGKLVTSFGAGLFNYPHGIFVDRDDNIWVCDGRAKNGKGETVMKFSSEGKLLMTLGKPGVAGDGPDMFNGPSDVLMANSWRSGGNSGGRAAFSSTRKISSTYPIRLQLTRRIPASNKAFESGK